MERKYLRVKAISLNNYEKHVGEFVKLEYLNASNFGMAVVAITLYYKKLNWKILDIEEVTLIEAFMKCCDADELL